MISFFREEIHIVAGFRLPGTEHLRVIIQPFCNLQMGTVVGDHGDEFGNLVGIGNSNSHTFQRTYQCFFHCLLQVISGIVEIHCIICIGVFVKLFRGKEVYKGTAEKPYITH